MQTAAEMNLTGPTGQVYALAVASELLFAATQDGRILAWRFSSATNCFEPAASLDGHKLAVVSLIVGGMRLYSASMDKTIRVCQTRSRPLTLILKINSIYVGVGVYVAFEILSSLVV